MKKSTKHFLIYSLLVSFFSFVFLSILSFAGIFTSLENKLYDWRMKSFSKKFAVSDDFCYIGIDQDSINSANREKKWGWPWPRSSYAEIVDF
ncbi:CHASE2 domain-containing protein [Treponema sp.]|uniref:CHASE2 domain-containing protein n=1 Tax=Treponema sp. TaxID=166 RepID=UPI003FD776FE